MNPLQEHRGKANSKPTACELQALKLYWQKEGTKAAGAELGVSCKTIESRLLLMRRRIGLHSLLSLVKWGVANGILSSLLLVASCATHPAKISQVGHPLLAVRQGSAPQLAALVKTNKPPSPPPAVLWLVWDKPADRYTNFMHDVWFKDSVFETNWKFLGWSQPGLNYFPVTNNYAARYFEVR